MKSTPEMTRRGILKAGGAALATIAIAPTAHADELVSPADPTALALGYVEDATTVDVAKWPKKAGPGGCAIFPGNLVKGAGWRSGWTAN